VISLLLCCSDSRLHEESFELDTPTFAACVNSASSDSFHVMLLLLLLQ
jgi:hypothetical protein